MYEEVEEPLGQICSAEEEALDKKWRPRWPKNACFFSFFVLAGTVREAPRNGNKLRGNGMCFLLLMLHHRLCV